jgi:glutaredoxin
MSPRLPVLFALCLAAATAARAGAIEDLFRGLIDRYKGEGKTILALPAGGAKEITTPVLSARADGLKLGRDQIAMFVAPGCRSCSAAAERLKKRGFHVEILDLSKSATAREAFQLSGAPGVPTVIYGQKMLGGWSDRLFDRMLKDDFLQKDAEQRVTGA